MAQFQRNQGIIPNEYLYSTVGCQFSSHTLSASAVTADADSNKVVNKGTLMALITSGDEANKIGPYEAAATDGREDTANLVGYLNTYSNLRDGAIDLDLDVSVLYGGTVNEDNVIVDGTMGAPAAEIKTALRTAGIDILHK